MTTVHITDDMRAIDQRWQQAFAKLAADAKRYMTGGRENAVTDTFFNDDPETDAAYEQYKRMVQQTGICLTPGCFAARDRSAYCETHSPQRNVRGV